MHTKIYLVLVFLMGQIVACESSLTINPSSCSIHDCGVSSSYRVLENLDITTFWDGDTVERFANKHFKRLFTAFIAKSNNIHTVLLYSFYKLDRKICKHFSALSKYGKCGCSGIVVVTDTKNKEMFCANIGYTRGYFFSPTVNGATATDYSVNNSFIKKHQGKLVGGKLFYKKQCADCAAGLGYAFFKQSKIIDERGRKSYGPVQGVPTISYFDLKQKWATFIIGSYWFNHLFYTNDGVEQFFKQRDSLTKDTFLCDVKECLTTAKIANNFYDSYQYSSSYKEQLEKHDAKIKNMPQRTAYRLASLASYGALSVDSNAYGKIKSIKSYEYPSTVLLLQYKLAEESV